jgi:hypothetical protein
MTYRSSYRPDPYILVTHFTVKDNTSTAANIITRDTTICSGSVNLSTLVSAQGIANPHFRWYYSEAGVLQMTNLTVSPTVTTEYWVSVEGDNHCEGSTDTNGRKKVTVNRGIGNSTSNLVTTSNVTICEAQNVTLTGSCSSQVTNPTYYWYTAQNATSPVHVGPTYTFSASSGTTSVYVAVMGSNYCDGGTSARKQITVTVNDSFDVGTISAPSAVCINSTISMNKTVNGGVWSSLNSDIATVHATTGEVTGLNAGTATIVYTVTQDGCSRDTTAEVTVLPNSNSSQITIQTTSSVCVNETVVLTAFAPDVINPVFKWYDSATATTPLFTGNPYTTNSLTEDTRFYVRVSGDNYCAAR